MKRRNADCGKLRRPIKRNKITEGMYGSNTILYMKFLMLWAFVITADFMLEFRFEFLWPFWLLLRSVHDSFKYKGLAFSILFVCIAITSDMICLFFIPVHWLFFAASTYVWVQYVWHTDKGICLPTIFLWMLFVYLEAAIRWKDNRHMPHLDLCRPFAAHCIGYPVVTLGFGFKTYVGYRMRQRKQREVAKENEFYMQLLQQALPQDDSSITDTTDLLSQSSLTDQSQLSSDKDQLSITGGTPQPTHPLKHSKTINAMSPANGHAIPNGIGHQSSQSHRRKTVSVSPLTDTVNGSTLGTTTTTTVRNHQNHQHSLSNQRRDNSTGHKCIEKDVLGSTTSLNFNKKESDLTSCSRTDWKIMENGRVAAGANHLTGQLTNTSSSSDSCTHLSSKSQTGAQTQSIQPTTTTDNHIQNHDRQQTMSNNVGQQQKSTDVKQQTKFGNGSILHYDIECSQSVIQPEVNSDTTEKIKGRRNRVKQKDVTIAQNSSKDNHQIGSAERTQQQSIGLINTGTVTVKQNGFGEGVLLQMHNSESQTVPAVCDSCYRLEMEVKRLKQEMGQYKQIENELKQKSEANSVMKASLLVKQKEGDEMDKKIKEMQANRHQDRQNIVNFERRLNDERRQRQTLESQLNNERKQKKQAEEKAAKAECGESCKQRKAQMEAECKQLRRELVAAEDNKKSIEQQNRNYEQELRAESRNRESTEVLLSALQAMREKNSTLEKNLSAETRVKLDLFSALGDCKRQLEITENLCRNKDKEVSDLKAKVAQLLAVMPAMPSGDSYGLPNCTSTDGSTSSLMRFNSDPSPVRQGPSSPSMPHISLGGSPLISQLQSIAVLTSTANEILSASCPPTSGHNQMQQQQQQQQHVIVHHQSQQQSAQSVAHQQELHLQMQMQNASNLDPNATAYTPKNVVGGAEA